MIAERPLPELPRCSEKHLKQCIRVLLASLPKRNSDEVSASLLLASYFRKLGAYSQDQISYLTDAALDRCEWFPTIAECNAIIGEWKRSDGAIQARERARLIVRNDRQGRFDLAMAELSRGQYSQDQINALPDSWKEVAETRGYLWLLADGGYIARISVDGDRVPMPSEGE